MSRAIMYLVGDRDVAQGKDGRIVPDRRRGLFLRRRFLGSGYTWSQKIIKRRVVVDSNFWKVTRKTQTVHPYEWYVTTAPDIGIDVKALAVANQDTADYLMATAQRNLSLWYERVFGTGAYMEHGGGACVLCVHRGGGHLPDHPVEPHGGLRRPVVGAGPAPASTTESMPAGDSAAACAISISMSSTDVPPCPVERGGYAANSASTEPSADPSS